ncbi:DUF2637 domain-containing protein [Nocardiopsis suaedae]|uniref:DUF2637 domain-containing protein n=1 Tax=Nocardiopsis suaedae TaxID=3018444 RepID=A0ABT4TN63_9ACTN|nr:DUF2637 domain-containing protein [Nocardiopsis suaedae]MDA2806137.1 DUF2637 domain-containing protein [Nocardiopsis suaedae]
MSATASAHDGSTTGRTSGTGRLVPWVAFITGAAVSIGANILHATSGGRAVDAGQVVAAAWAPIALLLVAEMVTRTRQSGAWWIVALRWLGTAVVAAVAAIVSYGHMRDLLLSYGESALVAYLLPLSVDGLILVASIALAPVPAPAPEPLRQETGTPADDPRQERQAAPEPVPEPAGWNMPAPAAGAPHGHPAAPVAAAAAHPPQEAAPLPDAAEALPEAAAEPPAPALDESAGACDPEGPGTPADGTAADLPEAPELSTEEAAARAAELITAAEHAGREITGAFIGRECGRSERWGRDQIRKHRTTPADDGAPSPLALVPDTRAHSA